MSDRGHELTDEMLAELEGRIKREYRVAAKETEAKLQAYLEKTEKGRLEQKALLDEGKITQKEYFDWCFRHSMVGKRWAAMQKTLAADMCEANNIARDMIKADMPDVYALNMNYSTYSIEHDGEIDTGFTLYNHDTAEYLLKDQRHLMPGPSTKKAELIRANKDMQWNMQKVQSAVLQGVLQGESPYAVAARLQGVAQMNASAAIRYARTMTTSAQNAGRYEAFRRASRLGVELTIEWEATLDGRTRHDHRVMHGQRRNVDEPFITPDGYTILYPADCTGDSDAPQKEIWNCRCTLLSWVKGFEGETVKESPKMGDMSFEEWQNEKFRSDASFRAVGQGVGGAQDGGEASAVKLVGEVDFSDEAAVIEVLKEAESNFAELSYECNATVTSDGRVWRVKGGEYTVDPRVIPADLAGSYSYHNHPDNVTHYSLSEDDVAFFFETKQAVSRSSDSLYEYQMSRTNETVDVDPDWVYYHFKQVMKSEVWPMKFDGLIDPDLDEYHETMKILSKELKFDYERKEKGR